MKLKTEKETAFVKSEKISKEQLLCMDRLLLIALIGDLQEEICFLYNKLEDEINNNPAYDADRKLLAKQLKAVEEL